MTFAELEYDSKKRRTRREIFLEKMEGLIPWQQLEDRIEPFYAKAGRGRRPYPLGVMLRVHCVQLFYNLSDPGMEDLLYEVESVRRFAGLRLSGPLPDETTILNFRHLLETQGLGMGLFEEINVHLASLGHRLKTGTIVDASIIDAPSSTKNRRGERDPEMHQTKKGNQWYFGMKAHIGVDALDSPGGKAWAPRSGDDRHSPRLGRNPPRGGAQSRRARAQKSVVASSGSGDKRCGISEGRPRTITRASGSLSMLRPRFGISGRHSPLAVSDRRVGPPVGLFARGISSDRSRSIGFRLRSESP